MHEKTRYTGHVWGNEILTELISIYANSRIKCRKQNRIISNRFDFIIIWSILFYQGTEHILRLHLIWALWKKLQFVAYAWVFYQSHMVDHWNSGSNVPVKVLVGWSLGFDSLSVNKTFFFFHIALAATINMLIIFCQFRGICRRKKPIIYSLHEFIINLDYYPLPTRTPHPRDWHVFALSTLCCVCPHRLLLGNIM